MESILMPRSPQPMGSPRWTDVPSVVCVWLCVATWPAAASEAENRSKAVAIADFQNNVSEHGNVIESFRIEGMVRAVVPERKLVALQDSSAAVLIELPALEGAIRPGEWVAVAGQNCSLTRSRFGI